MQAGSSPNGASLPIALVGRRAIYSMCRAMAPWALFGGSRAGSRAGARGASASLPMIAWHAGNGFNPYARPGPASLPLADPGASAKDHAAGAWPMTFRKILSLTKTTLLRMFWMETPHPYSDAPAVMLYVN
jgi:hypothetical protein